MSFASREDAGRALGEYLSDRGVTADLVLGLPRGGVVVADQVAQVLRCPLDTLVVRKIGHPQFREFAVGALGEAGVVVLDHAVLRRSEVDRADLEGIIAEEKARLESYQRKFASAGQIARQGKSLVIVDDGLATGATLEAAVRSGRAQGARRIVAAVPVSSTGGADRISAVSDEFHALIIDARFEAVGQYYQSFAQTTDEQVLAILAAHAPT